MEECQYLQCPGNLRPLGKKIWKNYNFLIFRIVAILGSKMESLGLGRWLKRLVEVLRFVVTEFRGVGSHEDPIRDQAHDFRSI